MKRLTQAEWLARARQAHGRRYGYAQSAYRGLKSLTTITCWLHGDFSQECGSHIGTRHRAPAGCPDCANEARRRTMVGESPRARFVRESRGIHGRRYGYARVDYVNTDTPVWIRCKIHGDFLQAPAAHLRGHGCKDCGVAASAATCSERFAANFLVRARAIHGDQFVYPDTSGITSRSRLLLHCTLCGSETEQIARNHLQGKRCRVCAGQAVDTASFIEGARLVHGDRYDYTPSQYAGAHRRLSIRCPIHDHLFRQTPNNHLAGSGCPRCGAVMVESKGLRRVLRWFEHHGIAYRREVRFDSLTCAPELRGRHRLRFDIGLLASDVLVEYDGEQHFRPVAHWGGTTAFERGRANDAAKDAWARRSGYTLIRVVYNDIDLLDALLGPTVLGHPATALARRRTQRPATRPAWVWDHAAWSHEWMPGKHLGR